MTAIDKVINIAKNEVGYMEKASNKDLYDKTANAGSNNYTKYWDELYPSLQAQPWCAIFVTWIFVKAFGEDTAKKLLKVYPFTYCPSMAKCFELNANPKKGDIVLFYRKGEFAHTGIVTKVEGDKFYTIEGNTSAGSTIIPNGGEVCNKSYYNSNLPGTKFVTPDYSIVKNIDIEKINEFMQLIEKLENKLGVAETYDTIDDVPDWAKSNIKDLIDRGYLKGDGSSLNLNKDFLKILVILDRTINKGGK